MGYLESILLVLYILVAVTLCVLVLLQHGKGADMGAAFGSGSSGSVFGASGSANFLSRSTAVLAVVFFLGSLGLTYLGSTRVAPRELMDQGVMGTPPATKATDVPVPSTPATPVPATSAAPAGAAPAGAAPAGAAPAGAAPAGAAPAGAAPAGAAPAGAEPSKAADIPK
jgi:preprotein translocase subunit SecG